jgi:hypothetical protein
MKCGTTTTDAVRLIMYKNTYRSESQERNISEWVRNASRKAAADARRNNLDIGAIAQRDNYIFPAHERPKMLSSVAEQNYELVQVLLEDKTMSSIWPSLDKLKRAYDAWSSYKRRQA